MHVRVRFAGPGGAGAGGEKIVALESRLSKVDLFRLLVQDKFGVEPDRQRLFYGGKLLENGYSFHDYNIKMNDVIQLMVRLDKKDSVKKNTDKKSIGYEDGKSNLFAVGDLIDMRDLEYGAWFEGIITGLVKDPAYVPPDRVVNGDSDMTTSKTVTNKMKNQPKSSHSKMCSGNVNLKSENNNSTPSVKTRQNRGIVDDFNKSSKNNIEEKVVETAGSKALPQVTGLSCEGHLTKCVDSADKDVGILYKVNLIYDRIKDTTDHYCKLQNIRPRARKEISVKDLNIGDNIMINHNLEAPHEKGYWYDFTISEIKKHRTTHELVGTLHLGADNVSQNDTTVKLHDKIYTIQEVVPLHKRTCEEQRLMITPMKQRVLPVLCELCRDNDKIPCKECGCFLCLGKNEPEKIILCDECNHGFHMGCLVPPMCTLPADDWYCSTCKRDTSAVVAPGAAVQPKKSHLNSKRDWGRGMACVGKSYTCAMPTNHFGPIPGIEVGMAWRFRIQLSESGVHRPPVSGIHGRDVDGAYSLVLSGGYEDDVDKGTEFTYTGSGGRDLSRNRRTAEQSKDQTLTRENKALARNCAVKEVSECGGDAGAAWRDGKPVRVARSYKMKRHFPKFAPAEGIRYDGIYKVVKYYPETGKSGFRVWKYLLRRDDTSLAPWDKNAKKYPIIYPDGYLLAEAEKRALKKKNPKKITKTNFNRVLKESNNNNCKKRGKDDDDSDMDYSHMKKKTRSSSDKSAKDKPLMAKTRLTRNKQPKKTKAGVNIKTDKKSSDKSPIKARAKSQNKANLEKILSEEEQQAIKADSSNCKLWEDCLSVCNIAGKKEFIRHVTDVFLCIICQGVTVDPVTTNCQHNFCECCLKLAFKETQMQKCPHCRHELTQDDLRKNTELKNALRKVMPGYDTRKK